MRSPPQAEDPKRQDEQKNSTIYVQNLNEKVHLVELKNSLFQLFSNIGVDVLEVHAKKNIKMRGQAFVVCGSEEQAEAAIKQLRGNIFYGKHLRLGYARKTSDVIAKMRGTFDDGVKAKRLEEQKKSLRNKELKQKKKMVQKLMMLRQQIKLGPGGGQPMMGYETFFQGQAGQPQGGPPMKVGQPMPVPMRPGAAQMHGPPGMAGPGYSQSTMMMQTHHTLFVSDLPLDLSSSVLDRVFGSSVGLKEIRMVRERGVAFVEYENEHHASVVLDQLKQSGAL
jgi:RNA recognition motif-containing protein